MMGNIHLRAARESDAAFLQEVYRYYIENTEASYNDCVKPVEAYMESIRELSQQYPFLIAEDEAGRPVGFANAEPIRPQSGYRHTVELTIYLHPDCPKGQGVGSLLYTTLLDCLKEQGFYCAFGVIDSQNQASIALHRHFGFAEDSRMEKVAFRHGKWLTAVYMRKQLRSPEGVPAEPLPFTEALGAYPKG